MSAGYVVARENFKEAEKHVSAETDPVMFNLLFGLRTLTNQIEADFARLLATVSDAQFVRKKRNPRLSRKPPGKSGKKKAPAR